MESPGTDCATSNTKNSVSKATKVADSEEPVDSESVKGIFGWETIDNTSIPYILRKGKKFVSVRIVERKLLSKYPNTFPDELGKKDPLISYFITESEATLLNEINTTHCDYEYGRNAFTMKDLIVDLQEFGEFFKIVKKTFPADILAKIGNETSGVVGSEVKSDVPEFGCGWIQINNTVSPYILRIEATGPTKFVPMHVIIYAAGLLTNISVDGLPATKQECAMLNEACKAAGVDFTFGKSTKLLSLTEVLQRCEVKLYELPIKNPLAFARYLDPRSGHPSSCLLRSQMSQPAPLVSSPSMMSTPGLPQKIDVMANTMAGVNPFMQAHHPMVHPASHLHNFGGTLTMRPTTDSNFAQQKLSMGPELSQQLENRAMDLAAQGPPHSFWSSMPQGPPPAHMGNGSRPNLSVQNPHMTLDSQSSTLQKPFGLPVNFPMHLKNNPGIQDFNQRMFLSSANSMQGSSMGNIRYPPPRIGLPQAPTHITPPPFGANQFDSSLFQKQQTSESANISQAKQKRKSRDSPLHQMEATNPTSNQQSARSTSTPDKSAQMQRTVPPSRPPIPTSSNNKKPNDLSLKIAACLVNGKSISCLQLDSGPRKGNFCLIEAVSKLYFPSVPLVEFVKAIQVVLQIQLLECSDEEEAAFVQYYNLPVQKLKCNKIVRVEDLEKYFPQLNYMFAKNASDSADQMSSTQTQPNHSSQTSQKRKINSPPPGMPATKQKLENVVQKLNNEKSESASGEF